jgi:hypothetical protein
MYVMKVSVMNIINVIFVFDGDVTTVAAVFVVVAIVCFARHDTAPDTN